MKEKKTISPAKLKSARLFNRIAGSITKATGRPIASITAVAIIIIWALTGPVFGFSDTWQLVINTGTTIITFLMVFVIQQTQKKDTLAIHLKLNELIACEEKASNRLIDIEGLTEEELEIFKKFYSKLSKLAQKENDLHSSHSLDEADEIHTRKSKGRKKSVASKG